MCLILHLFFDFSSVLGHFRLGKNRGTRCNTPERVGQSKIMVSPHANNCTVYRAPSFGLHPARKRDIANHGANSNSALPFAVLDHFQSFPIMGVEDFFVQLDELRRISQRCILARRGPLRLDCGPRASPHLEYSQH